MDYKMSCFLLSDMHIATIASCIASLAGQNSSLAYSQKLANKLKALNIESVNCRYNETKPRLKCKVTPLGSLKTSTNQLIRLIDCWVYQSQDIDDIDSLEFMAYRAYLYSFFNDNEISCSLQADGLKWTI